MADDNIINFPMDKVRGPVNNPEAVKRREQKQMIEFVENAVDDIALETLRKFVDLAMKTQSTTFMKDYAFLVDVMRSCIYRDFGMKHICQGVVDKTVELAKSKEGQDMARIDWSKVYETKVKTKPISADVQDELDEGGIEFIPDFDPPEDPDNDN